MWSIESFVNILLYMKFAIVPPVFLYFCIGKSAKCKDFGGKFNSVQQKNFKTVATTVQKTHFSTFATCYVHCPCIVKVYIAAE